MTRKILAVTVAAVAAFALVPGIALASAGGGGGVGAGPGPSGSPAISLAPTAAVAGGGVHWRNFCRGYWKNVRPHGKVGYNVYNDDGAGDSTCLFNDGNAGFIITRSVTHDAWGSYPDVSQGWQWGVSAAHAPVYPVQVRDAGMPVTSIYTRQTYRGIYNTAYDIWFSKTAQRTGQDNGAEVMIWLTHPGVSLFGGEWPVVRIEGVRFYLMQWRAFHNNTYWNYMAFVAVSPRSYFRNLWLDPFFRYAEHIGKLSKNWWLTSIDAGFELVSGGRGLAVENYSLTGVK
jgi:Glycosyl hydrolase family 12